MKIGILIFRGVEELDFVGPWEMLSMWKLVPDGPEQVLIVAQTKEAVSCARGLSVNPQESFDSCPQLDCLLVPGGQGTRTEVSNPILVDFVRRQGSKCEAVLSVCTGSFVLHAAGLLSGRKATTHWGSLDRLRALGDVEVVEQRFVQDGHVWTSAGVSAGIDLTLAFIAQMAGEDVAGRVQFGTEYYPSVKAYGDYCRRVEAPAYIRTG